MKSINRNKRFVCIILCILIFAVSGCGKKSLVLEYPSLKAEENLFSNLSNTKPEGLADDICVTDGNVILEDIGELNTAAGLFSVDTQEVVYANNIFDKMYPASITKVLTALVFFQNYSGDYSEVLVASENVDINESGVQSCGFKQGDKIPLEVALNGLLVYSGNDAAVLIAEYVAGSVDDFCVMMNETAAKLGATGSNFTNPHGLSDSEHYTTVYDIYLIMNEVMKYDKFLELISHTEYTGEYTKASGEAKKVSWASTNLYFTGDKTIPENMTVLGGKTGTTSAAGSCLMLLSKNSYDKRFISIVLKAENKASLYDEMSQLLTKASGIQ